MKNDLNEATINCYLFKNYQSVLQTKKNNYNGSVRPIEKSIFAEEAIETIDQMLECEKYDNLNLDCRSCRAIAISEKKIADAHINIRKTA